MSAELVAYSELCESYRKQILQSHLLAVNSTAEVIKGLGGHDKIVGETADLVRAAKKDLSADEFKHATDFLDPLLTKAYLSFHSALLLEKNPNAPDALSMARPALMITGSGPSSDNGHGPQKLHAPNFHSQAIRLRQSLVGLFSHYLQRRPLKIWQTEEISDLLASLEPLAEICGQLRSELHNRNADTRTL